MAEQKWVLLGTEHYNRADAEFCNEKKNIFSFLEFDIRYIIILNKMRKKLERVAEHALGAKFLTLIQQIK